MAETLALEVSNCPWDDFIIALQFGLRMHNFSWQRGQLGGEATASNKDSLLIDSRGTT